MAEAQTMTQTQPNPPLTARKYRSKRQRPCDLCRRRKTECKILAQNSICELCKKLGRGCTFVLQPLRKEKLRPVTADEGGSIQTTTPEQRQPRIVPGESSRSASRSMGNSAVDMTFDVDMFLTTPVASQMSPFNPATASHLEQHIEWPFLETTDARIEEGNGLARRQSAAGDSVPCSGSQQSDFRDYVSPSGSGDMPLSYSDGIWPEEFSLDAKPGYSSQLIGMSNETDPFLLRHFQYDIFDNYKMFRLVYRKMTDDANSQGYFGTSAIDPHSKIPVSEGPIQFQVFDESICEENVKSLETDFSVHNSEAEDIELMKRIVPKELGCRLLNLFFQFVQPSYPVFSSLDYNRFSTNEGSNLPVGLMAAMYAMATPFYFLDDQLCVDKGYFQLPTDGLWGIAHRSLQRHFQKPHLWLVQLCLLLLQRPPANFAVGDLPGLWALSCSAIAAAETLGLNLDPSKWRLPPWEIRLRKRLWWIVYTDHTWRALVLGRPSHLRPDSWVVPRLKLDELEADEYKNAELGLSIRNEGAYFIALCELSVIANDILNDLYTVKSLYQTYTLPEILARTEPLRARLKEWYNCTLMSHTAKSDNDDLHQYVPLQVAHMTLEVLLFRALLRNLVPTSVPADEEYSLLSSEIFQNALSCAKSAVALASSLTSRHFVNFWPSYARYHFAYISTFILLLFVQSPSIDFATASKELLEKWRGILRTQARAWPLLKLAAIRLDAIFWTGLEKVVSSEGVDTPAQILLLLQKSQNPNS